MNVPLLQPAICCGNAGVTMNTNNTATATNTLFRFDMSNPPLSKGKRHGTVEGASNRGGLYQSPTHVSIRIRLKTSVQWAFSHVWHNGKLCRGNYCCNITHRHFLGESDSDSATSSALTERTGFFSAG